MTIIDSELCFVLHTRPYRDTSLLVEFFTQQRGRLTAIAKGARRPKSPLRLSFDLFMPLLFNYYGKHEFVTLKSLEAVTMAYPLTGNGLFAGLYVNELLIRLLPKMIPMEATFAQYQQLLPQLLESQQLNASLRYFEQLLLQDLGLLN